MSHFRERAHRFRYRCHQMKIECYHRKYNNDGSPRLVGRDVNTPFWSLRTPLAEDNDEKATQDIINAEVYCDAFVESSIDGETKEYEDNEYELHHQTYHEDKQVQMVCDVSPPISAMSIETISTFVSKADYAEANNAIISNVKKTEAKTNQVVTIFPNLETAVAGITRASSNNIYNYRFENTTSTPAANSGNIFNFKFESSRSTNGTNSSHFRQLFGKNQTDAVNITSPIEESNSAQKVDPAACDNKADEPIVTKSKRRSFREICKTHFQTSQKSFIVHDVRPAVSNSNDTSALLLDNTPVQYQSASPFKNNNSQFVVCIKKYGSHEVINNRCENVSTEHGHQMSNKVSPAFELKMLTNVDKPVGRFKYFKIVKPHKLGTTTAVQRNASPHLKSILKKGPSSTTTRKPLAKKVRINSKTLCIDEDGKYEFKPTPTESDCNYTSIEENEADIELIQKYLATLKDPYSDEYQFTINGLAMAMVNLERRKKALGLEPTAIPKVKKGAIQKTISTPVCRPLTADDLSFEYSSSDTTASSTGHSFDSGTNNIDSIDPNTTYIYESDDTFSSDGSMKSVDSAHIAQVIAPDTSVDIVQKPSPFTDREIEIMDRCDHFISLQEDQKEAYELDQLMGFVSAYQASLKAPIKLPNISY